MSQQQQNNQTSYPSNKRPRFDFSGVARLLTRAAADEAGRRQVGRRHAAPTAPTTPMPPPPPPRQPRSPIRHLPKRPRHDFTSVERLLLQRKKTPSPKAVVENGEGLPPIRDPKIAIPLPPPPPKGNNTGNKETTPPPEPVVVEMHGTEELPPIPDSTIAIPLPPPPPKEKTIKNEEKEEEEKGVQWGGGLPGSDHEDNNNDNDYNSDAMSGDEEAWAEEEDALKDNLDDYMETVTERVDNFKRQKYMRSEAIIRMRKLPPNPEVLMRIIIAHRIEVAKQQCRKLGFEPTQISCRFQNKGIFDDVWADRRDIEADMVDYILDEFLIMEQSKSRSGINVYEDPFKIIVYAYDYPKPARLEQPDEQEPTELTGGAHNNKMDAVRHTIAPNQLIKVQYFIYFLF